jgi:hypothetical protein
MNEKNENAINGFETIPTTTPGMNLDALKGTVPRVENYLWYAGTWYHVSMPTWRRL